MMMMMMMMTMNDDDDDDNTVHNVFTRLRCCGCCGLTWLASDVDGCTLQQSWAQSCLLLQVWLQARLFAVQHNINGPKKERWSENAAPENAGPLTS